MSALALISQSPEGGGVAPIVVGIWILFLALFLGVELITKVPPTLHTPLMSGANAISGITIVGALACASSGYGWLGLTLGFLAIVMATINCVGGFLVTERMLRMFGSRQKKGGKA